MQRGAASHYSHVWKRFLPAIVVYPVWLYIMAKRDAFEATFGTYYPLSIAMIAGSMIAGSTPLGGAVVAFPVSVLVIKFKPSQGRDFGLMIQSVGMTAGGFLISYAKCDLINFWLVLWFTISGVFGLIIGFETEMSPFIVNVTFTTAVTCFAIAMAYRNLIAKKLDVSAVQRVTPQSPWAMFNSSQYNIDDLLIYKVFGDWFPNVLTAIACIFGLVGGILSSKLGSGSDMLAYIFGSFVWNSCVPAEAKIHDTMLTASSVIIMAAISVLGSIMRLHHEDGITDEVKLCWAACIPIVVLGAPLGSLLLTPGMTEILRRGFYFLSVVQLVIFGILKIKDNVFAWIGVAGAVALTTLAVSLHYMLVVKGAKGGPKFQDGNLEGAA
eukprot:TRINITY_DN33407_c0_g2_i1.p1 TRINITY_DN33407_c0_g2~~TRINITY_DN33407_c0_g2_i1.p1  ORF type:complete len:382 (+),score=61.38 TRINITY_DN33407_c0_g2_i1:196-1341(+)